MNHSEVLQGVEHAESTACNNVGRQKQCPPPVATDFQSSNCNALPRLEQTIAEDYGSLEGDSLPMGKVWTDTRTSRNVQPISEPQLVRPSQEDCLCVMDSSCTEKGAEGQQQKGDKNNGFVPAFCADFTPDEQDANHELMVLGRDERTKRRQEEREKARRTESQSFG